MSITRDSRPTIVLAVPTPLPSAGPDSPNGHGEFDTQVGNAVGGQDFPQAIRGTAPMVAAPTGSKASHSQSPCDAQTSIAAADDFPGGHNRVGLHVDNAAGDQASVPATAGSTPNRSAPVRDQAPPAASRPPSSIGPTLLADPLLALAADVLGDLEKVRIANENRLRQLTRSAEDSDGETRGFGLDEAHPDVARLAALVGMLADAEHKATLNLQRVMRKHPLGPWMAAQKGIGEKQGARLLAAIGDPYIRPEITREDGTVESSRPRMVSELWAYCGYHVVPADQSAIEAQTAHVGGGLNGSGPGHGSLGDQSRPAGVAPKRQRGQHANWSAAAKMRAYLVAEKCVQSGKGSNTPYYQLYAATKAKYADAVHAAECVRCGPKSKPAQPGSPISDGHKHARALRAVAKEVLKGLWREARRIHETSASGHQMRDTQGVTAAGGDTFPSPKHQATSNTASATGLT